VSSNLDEVRETAHLWLINYNERRPHDALNSLPPAIYREQLLVRSSTFEQSS
jgi:putative transposase